MHSSPFSLLGNWCKEDHLGISNFAVCRPSRYCLPFIGAVLANAISMITIEMLVTIKSMITIKMKVTIEIKTMTTMEVMVTIKNKITIKVKIISITVSIT